MWVVHTVGSGADCVGFHKGFALFHFPSVNISHPMLRIGTEVFVFVRVLRLVCFVIFHTVGFSAKGIRFSKGFALLHSPSVHVRAFRTLDQDPGCFGLCFVRVSGHCRYVSVRP